MKPIFYGICATACLLVHPAMARPASELCKNGTPTVMRISTIKATGTRAGFDKAVQDQIKWYRSHGVTTNEIIEADILTIKGADATVTPAEVVTLHYNAPSISGKMRPNDAAYDAFVAEFRANSDIAAEKVVCIPNRK